MSDPIKLDENTEFRISLKSLILIIFALVSGSWYVFNTQHKIQELTYNNMLLADKIKDLKQNPVLKTDVEMLKKDLTIIKSDSHTH